MLTTPAMASEPYCAEAPSRSTSTRAMAATGMVFRSTAAEPRPIVPLRLSSAEVWRRLPLTNTSTWSGERPRSCAGRIALVPSLSAGRGKFSDGSARANAVASSGVPVACSDSALMMSIGDCDSATVRSDTRVPVTMTVSRVLAGPLAGAAVCAMAGEASSAATTAVASAERWVCMTTPKTWVPAGPGKARQGAVA